MTIVSDHIGALGNFNTKPVCMMPIISAYVIADICDCITSGLSARTKSCFPKSSFQKFTFIVLNLLRNTISIGRQKPLEITSVGKTIKYCQLGL